MLERRSRLRGGRAAGVGHAEHRLRAAQGAAHSRLVPRGIANLSSGGAPGTVAAAPLLTVTLTEEVRPVNAITMWVLPLVFTAER